MNRAIIIPFCAAVSITLSGCIIFPGTSQRTPELTGRVIDARTHHPVAAANIALHDAPKLRSTTTDANGRFRLAPTHNFHIVTYIGMCGGPAPILRDLSASLDVSHPDYGSRTIIWFEHKYTTSSSEGHQVFRFRDILLQPKRR